MRSAVIGLTVLALGAGCGSEFGPFATASDAGASAPREPALDAGVAPPAIAAVPSSTAAPSEPPADEASACAPRSERAPRDIAQLMALLNALPRPTSLACVLESLPRPLDVYFTSSRASAQPAGSELSPRTFIVSGDLFLSIVPDGTAQDLLELGYRTSPERAVRGEIVLPLRGELEPSVLAAQIEGTDRSTTCGTCHGRETRVHDVFLGDLAFESEVIAPSARREVPLDTMRAEAARCDPSLERERCANLSALFDHGEVRASRAWASTR